ncbi:hypothetical protein Herbaro_06635 [Herbaspirillum sp. WKF16]|jgi:hypothetical protein|uniref:hypothetical protein n=1 Tax=Herbaspirillum sp. WKF16 TaxID=3028312 RepID=UPI0023A993BF|nr:hypothetical protein [Herbaspirillum sp. WKF16]WDZ97462.1 hypothetical protein Herbaro_06635 [Herbaspirillum sp. WKF16]
MILRHCLRLCALPLLLASSPCFAAIYKCSGDDAVVYADQPCDDAQRQAPPLQSLPTIPAFRQGSPARAGKSDPTSAGARRKENREKKEKADAAQGKKCLRLELHRRWAGQDLQAAQAQPLLIQDKTLENARRKARRADEQYRLECAAPS